MLEWNDYRVVLAIARHKSLYGCARYLDVAVSTVMRRLAQIENRIGAPVFRKTQNGYEPTKLGQVLIANAEEMEAVALSAEHAVQSARDMRDKTLRICASEVIAPYFVARHIPMLQSHCPDHEIKLTVTDQSPSNSAIEFDIALWPSTPSNEDLFGRKLTQLKWAIYGSAEHKNADQLALATIGLFGKDGSEAVVPTPASEAERSTATLSTNSLIASAAMAAAGGAAAFLPCIIGAQWPGLCQQSPARDHEIGTLWAIYRKDAAKVPHIRAAITALLTAALNDKDLFLGEKPVEFTA